MFFYDNKKNIIIIVIVIFSIIIICHIIFFNFFFLVTKLSHSSESFLIIGSFRFLHYLCIKFPTATRRRL